MHNYSRRKTAERVNKKWVKVFTVIAYVISVCMFATVLGLFYRYWWEPDYPTIKKNPPPVMYGAINIAASPSAQNINVNELVEQLIKVLARQLINDKTYNQFQIVKGASNITHSSILASITSGGGGGGGSDLDGPRVPASSDYILSIVFKKPTEQPN